MKRPNSSLSALLAFAAMSSLALLGCTDDPPTPTEVRGAISNDLGNVLRETNAAFAGGTDGLPGLPGTTAVAMVDRVLGADTAVARSVRAMTAPRVAPGSDADPPATDLVDVRAQIAYLNDKLFADANHVGNGIYQVPASLVCARTTNDSTGQEVQTIDAKCADALAKADLRIRVARDGDSLVFAIQVDADHDEPLRFTLTHTSLAITVDLDGSQRALVALAPVFGQDLPNVALAGQVTSKLEILGTAKLRASISIDRALSIKAAKDGASLDGTDALVLSSVKAEAFSITLDGHAKSGSVALGLGQTALKIPGFDSDNRRFELDLPGATFNAAFISGQPVTLTHLGLGDRTTTVSLSGARAQSIDLNPQDGRALDATVTLDATSGKESITVSPRLDLQMAIDHAVLRDTPPVYDITRVLLDGSLRASETSNQVEVVTGSYSVTTTPAGHGFTASAGQCVTGSSAVDPSTGRSYTQFTVGACP